MANQPISAPKGRGDSTAHYTEIHIRAEDLATAYPERFIYLRQD